MAYLEDALICLVKQVFERRYMAQDFHTYITFGHSN